MSIITSLPASSAAPYSTAGRPATRPAPATDSSWQLLAVGDEVSVAGAGAYQLVHLSGGSAWVEGVADRSQRLVAATSLRLIRACAGLRHS